MSFYLLCPVTIFLATLASWLILTILWIQHVNLFFLPYVPSNGTILSAIPDQKISNNQSLTLYFYNATFGNNQEVTTQFYCDICKENNSLLVVDTNPCCGFLTNIFQINSSIIGWTVDYVYFWTEPLAPVVSPSNLWMMILLWLASFSICTCCLCCFCFLCCKSQAEENKSPMVWKETGVETVTRVAWAEHLDP